MTIYFSAFGLNTYRVSPYFMAHVPEDYPLPGVLIKSRAFRRLPPRLRELSGLAKRWAERVYAEGRPAPSIPDIYEWYDDEGYELDPRTGERLTDKQIDAEWEQWEAPDIKIEDIPLPPGGFADPDTWEEPTPDEPEEEDEEDDGITEAQLVKDIGSHGREYVAKDYGLPAGLLKHFPSDEELARAILDVVNANRRPRRAALSTDAGGRQHRGKGEGGGQFIKQGGSSDEDSSKAINQDSRGIVKDRVVNSALGALSREKGLTAHDRVGYSKVIDDVTNAMPQVSLDRLEANAKSWRWYGTRKEVTKEFAQRTGAKIHKGEVVCGFFDPADGTVASDGAPQMGSGLAPESEEIAAGTWAHECGHAIDGPNFELSKASGWYEAYRDEHKKGTLSDYAATDPQEAFAEMCRAVYAPYGPSLEVLEKHLPLSIAYFRRKGLV